MTVRHLQACAEETTVSNITNPDKDDCCTDEIKSFSYSTEFANKIVSTTLSASDFIIAFFINSGFEQSWQIFDKHFTDYRPPAQFSGFDILLFKQVLNV